MSIEAISVVDADLARVASAQLQLSSAHAQDVPVAGANPSDVERGHAAVAAAEAALAAAQAALNAAQAAQSQAAQSQAAPPASDPNVESPAPLNTHLVDTTA